MLAVVKKPHTKMPLFEVKGDIPSHVLTYLKQTFGQDIEFVEDTEEPVDLFKTDWYRNIRQQTTPGEILRIYRENSELTQAELGRKLGDLSRQKISDIEHGRRNIGKEMARKLSRIFNVPVDRFLYGI